LDSLAQEFRLRGVLDHAMALDDTGSRSKTPRLRQKGAKAGFRVHRDMAAFNPKLPWPLALEPLSRGMRGWFFFDPDSCADDFLMRLLGVASVREKDWVAAAHQQGSSSPRKPTKVANVGQMGEEQVVDSELGKGGGEFLEALGGSHREQDLSD